MKKIFSILLTSALSLFVFTGCVTKNTKPFSDEEVYEKIDSTVLEPHTLINVDKKEDAPKEYTYYYKLDNRDLEFKVINGIMTVSSINFGTYYEKRIENNYIVTVINSYMDKISNRLENKSYVSSITPAEKKWENIYGTQQGCVKVFIESNYNNQVEQFLDDMEYANKLFADEKKYNNEEWMRNNYLLDYKIYLKDAKGKSHFAYSKQINGIDQIDRQKEKELIINSCINVVSKNELENTFGFDMSAAPKNISLVPYANGVQVASSEFNPEDYAQDKELFNAVYVPEFNDYGVLFNVNAKAISNPNTLGYFIEKADGKIKKAERYSTEFTVGADTYVVTSVYEKVLNRDEFTKLTITKNGQEMNVPFVRDNHYTYLVYLKLQDLGEIFNFDYTLDVDNEKYFMEFK